MKRIPLTIIPLVAVLLLVALFMGRLADPRMAGAIDSPLIGKPAPALGANIKPPYVINFFASWCTPCAIEHPFLMKMKAQGVQIIGIAYKDTPEKITEYLARGGNPYTKIVYDDKGDEGITFGITGVPESFAVDSTGIIRTRLQGPFADEIAVKDFLEAMP
ncbi:MAG: redoxin family protein [Alphaproteobacteria bacterium]|nr:redoxin family protein [Alphaproteobacteria bacterium]